MIIRLNEGDPEVFAKLLRYLIFSSSTAFVKYLETRQVNLEMQFMSDKKFYRNFTKVLQEVFLYRSVMSPEQFNEKGCTERKICLILDIYDLVKTVKKQSQVAGKLSFVDPKWEHPCD